MSIKKINVIFVVIRHLSYFVANRHFFLKLKKIFTNYIVKTILSSIYEIVFFFERFRNLNEIIKILSILNIFFDDII